MPVNLASPDPQQLFSVMGVSLGVAEAGIKKPNRKDLLVISLSEGAKVVGVFTQNRFCAAPVIVASEHLTMLSPGSSVRALVVNTGCANAGTGEEGLERCIQTCAEVAKLLRCQTRQVLPFSTGVIMEPLPVERIIAGLPACIADLKEDNWFDAAQAIMTTDTVPKAVSKQVKMNGAQATITGIAKGAGMIHPNMATMLAFVATDAAINQALLEEVVLHATRRSFNRITVDGDTSTNDAFMLIATGKAQMPEIKDEASAEFEIFQEAVTEVATQLAQAIVRDGEGATKFITIRVEGGKTEQECNKVAYAIAHSPLVKTAFFASDPNLGRILAAIGYAGIGDLDVSRLRVFLGDVLVAEKGGRAASYNEADGQRIMRAPEIMIRVALGRGAASSTVWTCDLSSEYVSINADYRS